MEEKKIDHSVLNTLYLMSEDLGKAYEQEGFNPFQEGYELNAKQIDGILLNNENNEPISAPEFLDNNKRSTLKNFSLSEKFNDELEGMVSTENFQHQDNGMNMEEVYLRCRKKMLQLAQNEIKSGGMSPLEAYEKMYRLNRSYAKVMEQTFVDSQLDVMKLREELARSTIIQENIIRPPDTKVQSQKKEIGKQVKVVKVETMTAEQKEEIQKVAAKTPQIKKVASDTLRKQMIDEEIQKEKDEERRKREEQLRQMNLNKKAAQKKAPEPAPELSEEMQKNFHSQEIEANQARKTTVKSRPQKERNQPEQSNEQSR